MWLPALTVTLTCALIQMVKKIAGKSDKARMITKARVTELIMSGGACLMNVWISARRNGDEDEDVFVFFAHWCHLVVRRRDHRHSDGAVPVPRVRLQAGDVQRQLDGGAGVRDTGARPDRFCAVARRAFVTSVNTRHVSWSSLPG